MSRLISSRLISSRLVSSGHESFPGLSAILSAWCAIGTLVLLRLPWSSWHNHYIGWLPWWLLATPLMGLAWTRRQQLAALLLALLGRARRRRFPGARRRQARRRRTPERRTQAPIAAHSVLIGS
jgi:hypothetical protein